MSDDRFESKVSDDEAMSRLLRSVGKRTEIPQPVRENAETLFRKQLAQARMASKRRVSVRYALAASLVVGLATVFWMNPVTPPVAIAKVEAISGEALWISEGVQRELVAGIKLAEGDEIETGEYPVRLTLLDNPLDIRLGRNSHAVLLTNRELLLRTGEVYIDTISALPGLFAVVTELGSIRHTGTQYLVQQEAASVKISVREGSVTFDGAAGEVLTNAEGAARMLIITEAGGISELPVSPTDKLWGWTLAVSPSQSTDGLSLLTALEWAARETGHRFVAETAVKQAAGQEIIAGDLGALGPLQQVTELVELTSRFQVVISDEVITLSLREGS